MSLLKTGFPFIGDGKTSFADYDYADDAARANRGGNWRTPTDAEWTWLRENCTWTWTTQSGVNGMLVRSNVAGYTHKTIFLPAAGEWFEGVFTDDGCCGYYWSSTMDRNTSYTVELLAFDSDSRVFRHNSYRYNGRSVRPVTE